MQRLIRVCLALALCAAPCLAADSDAPETRPLEAFTELEVTGSIDVKVDLSAPATALKGTAGAFRGLTTRLADGRLELGTEQNLKPEKDAVVEVGTSQLKLIRISGAADVQVLNYKGERLRIEVSGAGDVEVEGQCDNLEVEVSGAGDVHLKKLAARNASVQLAGAGDVDVHVTEALDVKISGVGDVRYWGKPPKVQKVVGGLGDLEDMGAAGE